MKLKEKIERKAVVYYDTINQDFFKLGADFAIKAVIEMLEERKEEMEGVHEWDASYEDEYIINLLKS